jgi:hypothetical protein
MAAEGSPCCVPERKRISPLRTNFEIASFIDMTFSTASYLDVFPNGMYDRVVNGSRLVSRTLFFKKMKRGIGFA